MTDGEVAFEVPEGSGAGVLAFDWTVGGVPIGDHSRRVVFDYAPGESGTYEIQARDASGQLACTSQADLSKLQSDLFAMELQVAQQERTERSKQVSSAMQNLQSFGLGKTDRTQAQASTEKNNAYLAALKDARGRAQYSDVPVGGSFTALTSLRPVYFVTEREPVAGVAMAFGTERSSTLRYGQVTVRVAEHTSSSLLNSLDHKTYTAKNYSTASAGLLDELHFYAQLKDEIARESPTEKQVFVYVHGFNNSFQEEVNKAAQLAYDTRFEGVPIVFDWPATTPTLNLVTGYITDLKTADRCVDDLAAFLQTLAERSGAGNVHIVAHSMGSLLLVKALKVLAARNAVPHFGQVIFAAPDVDAASAREVLVPLVKTNHFTRVTVYGSRKDWAMYLATLAGSNSPLGRLNPVEPLEGIDVVDASGLPRYGFGHDYFISLRPVVDDIYQVLQAAPKLPPRKSLLPADIHGYRYWELSQAF